MVSRGRCSCVRVADKLCFCLARVMAHIRHLACDFPPLELTSTQKPIRFPGEIDHSNCFSIRSHSRCPT